jgi:hypothetical protein
VEEIFLSVVQYNAVTDFSQAIIHIAETIVLDPSAF